jgi:hypothetical protein
MTLNMTTHLLFGCASSLAGLLGEQDGVNVGKDTSSGNRDIAQEFVEFFIILDGKSNVTRHDTALFVVTSSVSSKLEDLGTEILENGSEVDGSTSTHTRAVLSLTKVTSDTTNGELKSSLGAGRRALLFSTAALSFSCWRRV